MKDLYHQDVVEMIERETRKYELYAIEDESHPDFKRAFDLLWDCFGAHGEMEREEAIRAFLREDPMDPSPSGTYFKYFLLVAKDRHGNLRGVRDGTILVNPAYAPDLCVVYLSHIYMLPEARGTVLSYWLRIAPVELAVQYLADLHAAGKIALPEPNAPSRWFGMRMNLTAEMEYWTPEDKLSLQRILFYGRGGFDVINPRHFPYRQPDFRPPEEIARTGVQPVPFMILLRRMGRERQAAVPIEEAEAVMRLLYDDFACFCQPEHLASSLDLVLQRLAERRAKGKEHVELLPLPTGPKDLHRLKRIFRYNVYRSYYPDAPETRAYLTSGIRERMKNPRFLEEQLAAIARELDSRPHYVYGNRDKAFTWEGDRIPREHEPPEGDVTVDLALPSTGTS
jgi:hypothetical protein